MLRPGQVLFTYLHLAPDPEQAEDLVASGAVVHRLRDGDIAHRRAAAARADVGGRGAHGRAGRRVLPREAARRPRRAARRRAGRRSGEGRRARRRRRRHACDRTSRSAWAPTSGCSTATSTCCGGCGRSSAARSTPCSRRATRSSGTSSRADLVIGGVLIPGASAPKLVTRELVARMKPGSVVVDVAIDQGGCFETSRPTTHADPVVHRRRRHRITASRTCRAPCRARRRSRSTTRRCRSCSRSRSKGWKQALADDPHLRNGLNVAFGKVTCKPVAEALGYKYVEPREAIT